MGLISDRGYNSFSFLVKHTSVSKSALGEEYLKTRLFYICGIKYEVAEKVNFKSTWNDSRKAIKIPILDVGTTET